MGNRRKFNADLLAYQLGLADEITRASVEVELGTGEKLAAARANVQRVLSPLDGDTAEIPPDLIANVLAHVKSGGHGLTIALPANALAKGAPVPSDLRDRARRGGPIFSLRDLVGLAAAIMIFAGIFLPGYTTARSTAQRLACLNNMRAIGGAYVNYASANGGQWPFAAAIPANSSWLRTAPAAVPPASNSQHLYLLVRGAYAPTQAFVCPSRPDDAPLNPAETATLTDFPGLRNHSYATNLVTQPWRQDTLQVDMPIAADPTPLIEDGRLVPARSAPANSQSHGRPGQNVLRADVSVAWRSTPNAGIAGDDIYRISGVQEYTGIERPRSQTDAFLIP